MSSRLPAAERRAQLLTVALELFGTAGYRDTSMNDIAAAAGVTKPVLYQHFDSKEALFEAVLEAAAGRLATLTEKALANAWSERQQVELGFSSIIDICVAEPPLFRVLFDENRHLEAELQERLTATRNDLAAGVAAHLQGVADGNRDLQLALGHALIGMAESALRHWFAEPGSVNPETLKSGVVELAWAGLRGPRPA